MGLFSPANQDYDKGLGHYQKAKSATPLSPVFWEELNLAIISLREAIRKNLAMADALVVLSNIYYAIYIWTSSSGNEPKINPLEYLELAAAVIQHWKSGWRGYNKNSAQGNRLYQMITGSLIEVFPMLTSPLEIDKFLSNLHDRYYEKALVKEILLDR